MTAEDWLWNDSSIPDEEVLYRRALKTGQVTWDAEADCYRPNKAAFSRKANEGLSTHADSLLKVRGRKPHSLYNAEKYTAFGFEVAAVRQIPEAGVIYVEALEEHEKDPDLRFAHAEVRPIDPAKQKPLWNRIRDSITRNAQWVPQENQGCNQ